MPFIGKAETTKFVSDVTNVSGQSQTARDWSGDLAKLQNLPTDPASNTKIIGTLPTAHATGLVTAPTAGTVIADSGALAAGDYEVIVEVGSDDSAAIGKYILIEHRNAANNATLHRKLIPVPGHGAWAIPRMSLAANERIRAITGAAGAAGSTYTADIYVRVNA